MTKRSGHNPRGAGPKPRDRENDVEDSLFKLKVKLEGRINGALYIGDEKRFFVVADKLLRCLATLHTVQMDKEKLKILKGQIEGTNTTLDDVFQNSRSFAEYKKFFDTARKQLQEAKTSPIVEGEIIQEEITDEDK